MSIAKKVLSRHCLPALLLTSLISVPIRAAEWTHTLDLTEPGEISSAGMFSSVEVHGDTFWLGANVVVDALSGEVRDPRSMPEIRRLRNDGASSLVSSWHGTLWNRSNSKIGSELELGSDGQFNGWGIDASNHLLRQASDGAQLRRFSVGDIGFSGFHFISGGISAQARRDGVWVLLGANDGLSSRVVQLDGQARRLADFADSACASSVLDDQNGGVFVSCTRGSSGSVRRIASSPSMSWRDSVSFDPAVTRMRATTDGGLLLQTTGATAHEYRYVSAKGGVLLTVPGNFAALYPEGLWVWSSTDGNLKHYNGNGRLRAQTPIARPFDLTASESGYVLVRTLRGQEYSVLDRDARLVRGGASEAPSEPFVSRIEFNGGQPLAHVVDSYDATLIDDFGQPSSATFPVVIEDGPPGFFNSARADARTLCYEFKEARPPETLATPHVRCQNRSTGAPLGMNRHFEMHGGLYAVGPNVWVKTDNSMIVSSVNGQELANIDLRRAIDYSADESGSGIVIASVAPGGTRVVRYGASGELTFDRVLEGTDNARAFMSDGNTTVVYRQLLGQPRLDVLDHAGNTIAAGSPSDWPAGQAPVSALVTPASVMLLLQGEAPNYRLRSNTVLVLSRDLSERRARHGLPSSWRGHGKFWPSSDGDPRVIIGNDFGISLFHFEAQTGRLLAKNVLPITDGRLLSANYNKQYSVRRDGTLQMFHPQQGSQREVLKMFNPTLPVAGVPIAQPSLAGAWITPSSNGQGLIFAIDAARGLVFAAWHTYSPRGDNDPAELRWFTIQGRIPVGQTRALFPILSHRGGGFDQSLNADSEPVGDAELVMSDCDHLELWYRIGDEHGAIPLQRANARVHDCSIAATSLPAEDVNAGVDLDGVWVDPQIPGQGLMFASGGAMNPVALGGWFTYDVAEKADDEAAQHWFTVQGLKPARYGVAGYFGIFRTVGGSRTGRSTNNTHELGAARLTLQDCAHATLEYRFNDSAVAGAYADRSRTVQLVRLGSCTE